MPRLSLAAPILLLLGCVPAAEQPAAPVVTTRGDLTVATRDLRGDATLAAVGLAPAGDRREGESTWHYSFTEGEGRRDRTTIRRPFTLTIVNRGETARDFHARIDYLTLDGDVLRRRTLQALLVPPFTEVSWSGSVALAPPGDAPVLARVLPATEAFEEPRPE